MAKRPDPWKVLTVTRTMLIQREFKKWEGWKGMADDVERAADCAGLEAKRGEDNNSHIWTLHVKGSGEPPEQQQLVALVRLLRIGLPSDFEVIHCFDSKELEGTA